MARQGQPQGWNERHRVGLKDITLPEGVVFYSTPGHGYLRVDTRKHSATVTVYDYTDGPHHVLLEEDCSMTVWLAEHGLIPMLPYIANMQAQMVANSV
ncbi:hypothetical protein LCGC14_1430260 [marine sediment metagenome]|uniref:Uncharacterized protein n=1 Tax=marine sediment metagenome TaxID=412755 RepID=A0A0F9JP48_9ZZZZ